MPLFDSLRARARAGASASGSASDSSTQKQSSPPEKPLGVLRVLGGDKKIALRPFHFLDDFAAVASWQQETYSTNFPAFHYTTEFAEAFRYDVRRAALDPHHGLFVLDDGDALQGFLWLTICKNNWTGERFGYVNNVYVAPAYRGRGLGKVLMEQAREWFQKQNVAVVRLSVTASNAAACRLYESCGYRIERYEMELHF